MDGTSLKAWRQCRLQSGSDWQRAGYWVISTATARRNILWQNASGPGPPFWEMNGLNVRREQMFGFNPGTGVGKSTAPATSTGRQGRHRPGRNTDGTAAVWLMDATTSCPVAMSASTRAPPGTWSLQPSRPGVITLRHAVPGLESGLFRHSTLALQTRRQERRLDAGTSPGMTQCGRVE